DLVEEDLAELRAAERGLDRSNRDARRLHVDHQPRDALGRRRVRIAAHQHLGPVSHVGERAPDLLAVDDVLLAVAHRSGAQRGEVGPRVRLREPLTPHFLAGEDPRQVGRLLLGRRFHHERRPRVHETDEVHADGRRPVLGHLLEVHQLLARRRAATAVLDRPAHARVPGVEQPLLPVEVEPATGRPVSPSRFRRELRQRAGQPRPQLVAERPLGVGQLEIYRSTPSTSPLVGTPVPAVTSTCSAPSTWLTDVPRTCRTPSAMPFIPWMYASPSWPPWVLIGSRPPSSMLPSRMKSLASPGLQKPNSSSCTRANGVKWS